MKDQVQASIPTKKLDPPGLSGELFVIPVFKKGNVGTNEERLNDKSHRRFSVQAALGKQALQQDGISIGVAEGTGASYIKAPPDATSTKLHSPDGEILIYHNSGGELARVEFECETTSASEARSTFLKTFTPYVDHISFLANVPLYITQVSVRDQKHEIQVAYYLSPYQSVQVNPREGAIHNDLIPIYALYREAKNSDSPFYRFLCYFKILEGIFSVLRPKCFKVANENGKDITRIKELVPSTNYLNERFPDLVGKPIKPIFDGRFQTEFRNKVAHYLLESNIPLNVSDFNVFSSFGAELGLIEACARTAIETQAAYLSELNRK
jgi:hypothetical protein